MSTSNPKILIAIPTHRRPDTLKSALASLDKIACPPQVVVEVLVVENDTRQRVASMVAEFDRFATHYVLEQHPGLVHVRNRILQEARAMRADYLAGFDDDQTLSGQWLQALWGGLCHYGATVAAGPVLSRFAAEPPRWIVEGNFFKTETSRRPGQLMKRAGTNNYLLDMAFLKNHSLSFDEQFNFIGSEDTDFFTRIVGKGGKIVWIQEAVAYETVPPERMTMRYLIQRDYRIGLGRAARARKESLLRAVLSGIFGLITAAFYAIVLPFHWTRGRFCKRLCKIVKQWAVFAGLFRINFKAYGTQSKSK